MDRPWITPNDVKNYSDLENVKIRTDTKLKIDIQRAEAFIISHTNNSFTDSKYADKVPEDVKVADIILAEYFAHNTQAVDKKTSETFDDYSYTISSSTIDITSLGIDTLLEPYVMTKASGKVTMRLRKL